jgi:uroporphyrinogen-III decarboxylase
MKPCWFGTESGNEQKRYKTLKAEQTEFIDAFKTADVAI